MNWGIKQLSRHIRTVVLGNLVSQLGDRCDRVLIQCYDGGAGNNPSDWHLGNRAVHAGRMNYQEGGVDACIAQMESWKKIME